MKYLKLQISLLARILLLLAALIWVITAIFYAYIGNVIQSSVNVLVSNSLFAIYLLIKRDK